MDSRATNPGPAPGKGTPSNSAPQQEEPSSAGNSETEPTLTSRSIGGALWVMSGHGAQAGVQAISLVVFARLLSPTDFGLVGAAMVVVGISQIFSQLGIGPAIVQRPDLSDEHVRTGFWLSVSLGALLAVGVYVGSPAIAVFFRMEDLVPLLRVAALLFVVSGVGSVATGLLQRDLRFRELSLIRFLSYVVGYMLVGLPLAISGAGAWSLLGASLAQRLFHTGSVIRVRPHPKAPLLEAQALRDLTYFGSGLTLAQVFNYVATQGDNLVVGRWLGAEALGLYGRAYQLMVTPSVLLGQAINMVLFPAMAQVQDAPERLARGFRRAAVGSTLVMLPVSCGIIVLAPEIVRLVLGPSWDGVVEPFRILAGCIALRTIYTLGEALARAKAAVFRGAWRQGVFAAASLAGALIGKEWGLSGVAWGILVAVSIKAVLMTHLSLSLASLRLPHFLGTLRPAVQASLLVGLVAYGCAVPLRTAQAPPIVVIALCVAAALAATAVVLRVAPKLALGEDGLGLAQSLAPRFFAGRHVDSVHPPRRAP